MRVANPWVCPEEALATFDVNVTITDGRYSCTLLRDVQTTVRNHSAALIVALGSPGNPLATEQLESTTEPGNSLAPNISIFGLLWKQLAIWCSCLLALGILVPWASTIGWMKVIASKAGTLDGECGYHKSLREAARWGAYVVLFCTEPQLHYIQQAIHIGRQVHARELWSHSMSPIGWYVEHKAYGDFMLRYFPAEAFLAACGNVKVSALFQSLVWVAPPHSGCARVLDVGADWNATPRDLTKVHLLGNWFARKTNIKDAHNASFAGNLHPAHRVNHPGEWRRFMVPMSDKYSPERTDFRSGLRNAQSKRNFEIFS
eukprot:6349820-Amphidinium_carterae.2